MKAVLLCLVRKYFFGYVLIDVNDELEALDAADVVEGTDRLVKHATQIKVGRTQAEALITLAELGKVLDVFDHRKDERHARVEIFKCFLDVFSSVPHVLAALLVRFNLQ